MVTNPQAVHATVEASKEELCTPRECGAAMGGKVDDLSELSKNLSVPANHPRPEEYIRETLLAHGFFGHTNQTAGSSSGSALEQKPSAGGISDLDKKRTTQLVSQIREGREVHSLKEPQNLFSKLPARLPETKLALWPSEVQCVSGKLNFLATPPSKREPFYRNNREVVSPKIRSGEGGGAIVYSNLPSKQKFYVCSRAGPSISAANATPSRAPDDTTLIFESRFESGNLGKAVQVGRWDYELYMRFDLYTNKHTQWFYFSVENMRVGQTYRFTVVNFYKAGSLYNDGMQPVMYSTVRAQRENVGWKRAGHAIKYFKTDIRRQDTRTDSYYYAMTWSYTFQHASDTVYFAHCYPYTYSDLQSYLHGIQKDSSKSQFVKQRTLCHTIAGNPVPILTITSKVKSPEENRCKRVVVITSRVHPGETNGSWMMKGLLDFLVSTSPDAQILRNTFIFKVIPMLNPDGVIVGNYRCSLSGRDLNRNYKSKLKESYPTVWHTKAMVKKISETNEVVLYCDLHGHSRKHNVFIYGCDQMDDPLTRLRSRVFPKMLSKNAPSLFSYKDSKFGVHKSKEGTGRVVMWREMGITNSYTMEATFCGSQLGRMKGYQFSTSDLEAMGFHFCDTLLDYCDPDQSKVEHILEELSEEYRCAMLAHLASVGQAPPPGVDPLDLQFDDFSLDLDSSDGGSDSSVSDGLPVHILAKEARKKRKKKLKSRRERNKKKALLKMTKVVAPPPAPPTQTTASTFVTEHVPAQQPLILSYHHDNTHSPAHQKSIVEFSYTPNDVARNGGIPVFIQERIDERQKRRSDADSAEKFSDELLTQSMEQQSNIDALTMELMRQGFPPPLPELDPRSSSTILTRPPPNSGFPMNITPIPLWEGRGQSRPPSRLSSKTALPHLDSSTSNKRSSIVPFTSQYLARHLHEEAPADQGQSTNGNSPSDAQAMSLAQNSTRNLANLSRLFRQLRPHLLQNISNHNKISQKQLAGQVEAESSSKDARQLKLSGNESRSEMSQTKNLGVAELPVQVGGASKPIGPSHSQTILMKQLHSRLTLKRSEAMRSKDRLSSPEKVSPSVSQQTLEGEKRERQKDKAQPPRHDRKILADVYPSNSFQGSIKGSPLTSSWESFTRPVKLAERRREEEEEEEGDSCGDAKVMGREEGQRSKGDSGSDVKRRHNKTKESKLASVSGQQSSGLIPHSTKLSPPSFAVAGGGEVEAHKRRIAKAVDHMREQKHLWQHQSKANRHIKDIVTDRRIDDTKDRESTHTSMPKSPSTNEQNTTNSHSDRSSPFLPALTPSPPSLTQEQPSFSSGADGDGGRGSMGGAKTVVSSSDEEMRRRLEVLDVDIGKEGAPDNQKHMQPRLSTSSKKFVPVSTSFIYSTKPPSLYGGPKPSPDSSSRPTTVSLMLARRGRDPPPSVHAPLSPSRQGLHGKYYSGSAAKRTSSRSKSFSRDLT